MEQLLETPVVRQNLAFSRPLNFLVLEIRVLGERNDYSLTYLLEKRCLETSQRHLQECPDGLYLSSS